jgi:ABC-type dipeptide/oligopeptide/nickel transport system permease subunit
MVITLAAIALLAPLLSPYDPRALSGQSLERPSAEHLLGTNNLGQDLLSQLIWGTRISLVVALGAATLTMVVGVTLGVAAGLRGGVVDTVAMRAVDLFLAMPVLPLLILVAALAGPSLPNMILVMGAMFWPFSARVLRAQTLSLRQRGFVHAARGFGGGTFYLIRRHLVPALGPVISATFVNVAAIAVLLESGLAFLGLADPIGVSWGLVLNRALLHQGLYFSASWVWWVLPAGFAITTAVLGFTFMAVGLETRFNPRLVPAMARARP